MNEGKFRKIAWITLISIYLVILAGSVVRTTGSGMGCPDWPKCFGTWIPPTDESELPDNYQETYTEQRVEKAQKFADFLEPWFPEAAKKLRENERIFRKEEPFNAARTWTEYVNRLVGFVSGNLMLLQFVLAILWFRKKRRSIVFWSLFNLLLIGFQAWFGSIVVATNLVPWVISVHMFLALLIVVIQIHLIASMRGDTKKESVKIPWLSIVLGLAVMLSLVQVYFGTLLRQEIDALMDEGIVRSGLIEASGDDFKLHRSFAWLILMVNAGVYWLARKKYHKISMALLVLLGLEVVLGIILSYMDMPKFAQPSHLLLACAVFSVQIALLLQYLSDNRKLPGEANGSSRTDSVVVDASR